MAEQDNEDVLKHLRDLEPPLNWERICSFAQERGLKPRSVLAVAVRNGLEYRRKEYVAKNGNIPTRKAQLVSDIAGKLGFEAKSLAGLEKAGKESLQTLLVNLDK